MQEEWKEERYEPDGYHWAASVPVRIPWYQCTLECTVIRDQAMSELENIFCKCVLANIQTAADIAFVLALDLRIVQGQLDELEEMGLLENRDGRYQLTDAGSDSFARHTRAQKGVEEYTVYLNSVTGKWSAEPPASSEAARPEGKVLMIQPLQAAEWPENEETLRLRSGLDLQNGGHILAVRFQGAAAMAWQDELMLVYQKDGERNIKLAFLDEAQDKWDIDVGAALDRQYERRELLGLLQVEALVQAQRSEGYLAALQPDACTMHFCRNREIRELLKTSFHTAQQSIFIIAPWIDHENYVVTEELLASMQSAMERGVRLTIGYGYLPESQRKKMLQKMPQSSPEIREKNRNWQTEQMAAALQKRFAGLPFEMFYVGTHEKILLIDDRCGYIGSFNLLSYDGGEQYEFQDFLCRREGGVIFDSPQVARQILEDYQNVRR